MANERKETFNKQSHKAGGKKKNTGKKKSFASKK